MMVNKNDDFAFFLGGYFSLKLYADQNNGINLKFEPNFILCSVYVVLWLVNVGSTDKM